MSSSLHYTTVLILFLSFVQHSLAQVNWKNAKNMHYRDRSSSFQRSNNDFLNYYANSLSNERNFRNILKQILIPRPVGSKNHQKVQQFIKDYMENLGWDVEESRFKDKTPHGDKFFNNIIATLNPDAPRRLVLACHYDSKVSPRGFVGATDSAVPCSQMMNLAYTMQLNLQDYSRLNSELTLQFLFLDGEEAFENWTDKDSIYGARNLARKWRGESFTHNSISGNTLDRIDAFVLLDLIGEANPTFMRLKSETTDWFATLVDIEKKLSDIRAFNSAHQRPMFVNRRGPGGIQDDHLPFERANVPILHLITFPFPENWHKITDDENHLNYPTIANLNKIFRVFVAEYLGLP